MDQSPHSSKSGTLQVPVVAVILDTRSRSRYHSAFGTHAAGIVSGWVLSERRFDYNPVVSYNMIQQKLLPGFFKAAVSHLALLRVEQALLPVFQFQSEIAIMLAQQVVLKEMEMSFFKTVETR